MEVDLWVMTGCDRSNQLEELLTEGAGCPVSPSQGFSWHTPPQFSSITHLGCDMINQVMISLVRRQAFGYLVLVMYG